MMNTLLSIASILALGLALPTQAEVTDAREDGFTIETTVLADASPAVVYTRLIKVAG